MCKICDYWAMEKRPCEIAALGRYRFNLDKAKRIAVSKKPVMVRTRRLQPLLEKRKDQIEEEHLDHVSVEDPLLCACVPPAMDEIYSAERPVAIIIDGYHRLARAIRDKARNLKVVMLTVEETLAILLIQDGDTNLFGSTKECGVL